MDRRAAFITVLSGSEIAYLLNDSFNEALAAGSVNGTNATPTGGARTVVDANSVLSIANGALTVAAGGVTYGNPGLWYPSLARASGRTLVAKVNRSGGAANKECMIGFDANTAGTAGANSIYFFATTLKLFEDGSLDIPVGTMADSTDYLLAIVLRDTSGALHFIKGGTYTNWTLLYPSKSNTTATLYPCFSGRNAAITVDYMRIPQDLTTITPLVSDAFARVNGLLGFTGGGGSVESGGDGKAWTAQLGTWGVVTNKAASSALDGTANISIATVDASNANVIAESVITRSAGSMGLALRYTDADNYIKVFYDGTNWQIDEIVDGTPNTILAAAAATYGATKRTVVSLNGTKVRLYYGDALVGAESTTAITTGNNHGLFTSDTGATFDNFVVFAKGNSGEYEGNSSFP